ncbi:ubiquitin carboxyl-terminal hydrolase 44 isoform X3 [Notechis scutatus]|uniref:Ubiquitin carboxyl-terminal hydrolase n=1 Tax=Notechis scutatus TaxID=8663 RepID=A0A6J1WB75_9SAUR|nr:ubiquitin carboxyl-terminal hydrolase 44 isoform X3 [Notechis scutatus]
MDKCKHVGRLRLAQDHSIVNPHKWHCMVCNTTESVWACLSCSHVACGRYIEEHALKHFHESNHPVALEVNELYIFCYLCDDYVLNDNATGDIKLLRSILSAIKSQNYDCTTRSGRILRSMGISDDISHNNAQALLRGQDRMFTALWHRRYALMGKVFRTWFELTPTGKRILEEDKLCEQAEERRINARKKREERKRQLKEEMEKIPPRKSFRLQKQNESSVCVLKMPQNLGSDIELKVAATSDDVKLKKINDSPAKRRPTMTPGVTGLRNLGNTCYMNSILQVTCLACDNKSNTVEPFWDLSLEFPERYHCNGRETTCQYPCLLTEMLAKFTETEALEGKIYACNQCNTKRRKFSSKPVLLTEAQKQLLVCHLPQILRLHLKRFRWSGRNHREKIGVHVNFDEILNMEPYCCRKSLKSLMADYFIYDLSAVVMHHGKGFGSGHYTAYCYNSDGGFWVHCNDSKLTMCTMEEVCKAQAYILFYTQRVTLMNGHWRMSGLDSPSGKQANTEVNGSNAKSDS